MRHFEGKICGIYRSITVLTGKALEMREFRGEQDVGSPHAVGTVKEMPILGRVNGYWQARAITGNTFPGQNSPVPDVPA